MARFYQRRGGDAPRPRAVLHNEPVQGLVGAALEFTDVSVVSYLIAFVGGLISFLSPCVLPLAPGYLSMVSGLDLATLEHGGRRNWGRILSTTAVFITGFGAVFTLWGVTTSSLGRVFFEHRVGLTRMSGAVMVAMALFMLGSLWLKAPWLYRDMRFHPRLGAFGKLAPFVMGVAFGFGWSPCIGPTLASVLSVASVQGRPLAGATLMIAYSLGLGVPFLVLGLALGRLATTLAFVKRHFVAVVVASSLVMAAFGVLLLTNNLVELSARLSSWLRDTPFEWIVRLG
jgi:cytochrome c-type biogenesis protein